MYAIVIPIGGDGKRVSKLTGSKTKPELKINKNKKIIDLQIEKVKGLKKKIIFLSNIKFESLNNYILKKYKKLDIEIVYEKKKLGTAGCLYQLKKFKYKFFLVIYGDLVFNMNLKKLINFHRKNKSDCTLTAHPNNHYIDSDCMEIDNNFRVRKLFIKPHKEKNVPNLCFAGINVINKKLLKYIKCNKLQDFSKDLLKSYEKKFQIYAYNTREYIKDAGTPERIIQIKKELNTIKFKKGNIDNKIPAIFLDKDGVINKLDKSKHYQIVDNLINGTLEALSIIRKSGFLLVMLTNQPAIAKGIISESKFLKDINKLSNNLSKYNLYFDRIYYCPHHPEKGHKDENKKYKIICNCRKPNNGMFIKAIKELNVDIKNSFMIGDSPTDYMAAKKTRIKFIGVNKRNFSNQNVVVRKNLLDAVKYIYK